MFPQLFRVLPNLRKCFYLTIRLVARKGDGAIAHEARPKVLIVLVSNCFSITQLVGQKKAIINSAKKYYLFGNKTK